MGVEKFLVDLVEVFEEKFGVLFVEGYGMFEFFFVVCVNILKGCLNVFGIVDLKFGMVGFLLLDMEVCVIDLDFGVILEVN